MGSWEKFGSSEVNSLDSLLHTCPFKSHQYESHLNYHNFEISGLRLPQSFLFVFVFVAYICAYNLSDMISHHQYFFLLGMRSIF